LALLFLLSGCGMSTAHGAPMEQCNFERDAPKNSILKIELARYGATGYQWFAEVPKSSDIRLLDEGLVAAKKQAGLTGEPVTQWWTFQVGAGKAATVDFFLYRVWEGKEHAIKHCVAQVTIK
jgi:predicted secreted protein